MKQVEVFIVIEHLRTGGAELMVLQLARSLDRSLFNPVVVTFLDGELEDAVEQSSIELIRIRSTSKFGRLCALFSLLRNRRPAVVHTHMSSAGYWARLAGVFSPATVFVHSHHELTFRNRPWKRYLPELGLMAFTDRIVCVSEAVRRHLTEEWRLPDEKLLVIRNGIDARRFRGQRTGFHTPVKLVAVGRLHPVKAFDVLLRALAILRSSKLDLYCTIVGGGDQMQSLQALSHELSLTDSVEFKGFQRDIPTILKHSDIFVMASHREGLSLALLEAMASGLPIVATSVGGNGELLGDAGRLVPPGDAQALASAIRDLIEDRDAALTLGQRARDRILEGYSIESTVRSHERLYLDLLERRKDLRRKAQAVVM